MHQFGKRSGSVALALATTSFLAQAQISVQGQGATSAAQQRSNTVVVTSSPCGELTNAFGPFDYRVVRGPDLEVVERFHYTREVDMLVSGKSGTLGGDISYTLRAFPNHHRALVAISTLSQRLKTSIPPGASYTVDCFFDRAVRYAPDDAVVRLIFATHLGKTGRVDQGVVQARYAAEIAGDFAITHYNAGLVFLELGRADLALTEAHRAIALGDTRPALKNRLVQMGKWQEAGSDNTMNSSVPASSTAATSAASR